MADHRINQFPEWFTVEPDATYLVKDGGDWKTTGKQLLKGIAIDLKAGESSCLTIVPIR
jgi:hypothetical protein